MHLAADLRHGLGLSPTASASDACFHCSSTVDHDHDDHIHTHSHAHTLSLFSPESAMSVRSVSPGPLLSRLARGAGRQRRHKSESPISPSLEPGNSSHGRRADSSGYGSTRGSSLSSTAAPSLTWEEFDALPLAIQRKYFSTLERLRFAQDSRVVDGIYQHYDAISAQHWKPRRKPRPHRSASEHLLTSRLRRRSLREPVAPVDATDYRFYESLPDKIKKRQFTREEQVLLAGQLRASVILDAADEAIYKLGRRSSVHQLMPSIEINSPSSSHRASMESQPLDRSVSLRSPARSPARSSARSPARSPARNSARSPVRNSLRSPGRSPGRSVSRNSSHRTVHTTTAASAALASATATTTTKAFDQSSIVPESFYNSFRWVDEDDDLDLRLFLDDYHANLRDSLPPPTPSSQAKDHQPSFRRQMSVSRKPFSLPLGSPNFPTFSVRPSRPVSGSTVKPATAVSTSATSVTSAFSGLSATSPRSAVFPVGSLQQSSPQPYRKSRALSLITPRHTSQSSVSSIDPGAAHYQDPEARLKLRVYLASPQKFDEAIEFGFPSTAKAKTATRTRSKKNRKSRLTTGGGLQRSQSDASRALHSFLDDEEEEEEEEENNTQVVVEGEERMGEEEEEEGEHDDEDQTEPDEASMPDPDSPKTPNLLDSISHGHIHVHGHGHGHGHGHSHGNNHRPEAPVSREMTLRMTLTRPDLRACEEDIYGWQQPSAQAGGPAVAAVPVQHQRRHSQGIGGSAVGLSPGEDTSTATGRSSPATFIGPGGRPKESIEQMLAGIDHWGPDPSEKGVMKRFWNRMRRS